jgi:purine-nucleoside phosphorylase
VTGAQPVERDLYARARAAAEAVHRRFGDIPAVAVVLGSGLGPFAASLDASAAASYDELPHWPVPRVSGHEGRLVIGTLRGRRLIALAGRSHLYEGDGIEAVTFAVRVLGLVGVRTLVLTNAAGAIRPGLEAGELMVIDDHINLMGSNPLTGPNDDRFGPRFPDMSAVYSPRLRAEADAAARAAGVTLSHGVYAAVSGPSYETPAEIRYLRTIGADAVGMSTVPEAIVARHMGIEVLGIACISNAAAGSTARPLDHREVIEAAGRAALPLTLLLEEAVGRL